MHETGDASPERANRDFLRTTFDAAADRYQRARPEYPAELFEVLIEATGISPESRLLEVGCATGKATLPLARRGYSVTCIELGEALAGRARDELAGFPRVSVINADFDSWEPPSNTAYDLVFAATAWQWLDPDARYRKAWQLLRPGGWLAFWDASHVFPCDGDPFFERIQEVYDEIGEGLPPGSSRRQPGEVPERRGEVEAGGWFECVEIRQFDWEVVYDAEGYVELLNTFSNHIAMEPWQRERLFSEVRRRLAARRDGLVRRHWGAALHVARRSPQTATGNVAGVVTFG